MQYYLMHIPIEEQFQIEYGDVLLVLHIILHSLFFYTRVKLLFLYAEYTPPYMAYLEHRITLQVHHQ